jgi:hypothetical protein
MATNNIRKELIDLALTEKQEYKFAKILAFYYPKLKRDDKKSLFESLFYYYKVSNEFGFDELLQELKADNAIDNFVGKDYRIKSFEVSNLRGIPDKNENGIPFGMNLLEENIVNNAIILANNGTGKSSIFAGLEMIFSQEIGEKKLRTHSLNSLGKDDYDNYLRRFPNNLKPNFIIHTNEGDFSLDNIIFKDERIRNMFNPSNHFVSDFDIYHYGQVEYDGNAENKHSFHSLIADSLGLGDYIKLESILIDLKGYKRSIESSNFKNLEKQQIDTSKSIQEWEKVIDSKTKELLVLKEENSKKVADISIKKKIDNLKELSKEGLNYDVDKEKFEISISEFNRVYLQSQSAENNAKQSLEKDFLEMGVNLIHEFDNCPFCNDSKKSVEEIQKEVVVRLNKLKELQKKEEELKEAYKVLCDNLSRFFRETQSFHRKINQERTVTSLYGELTTLFENENNLYVALAPHIEDTELIELVENYNRILYPKSEDIKGLFDLLNNNKSFFIESFPQFIISIQNFIGSRNDLLQKVIDDITKEQPENIIEKQIGVLEEDITRLKLQIDTGKKLVESLEPQILAAKNDVAIVDAIKKEVVEFLPSYKAIVNKLVNEAFDPVKEIVETILSDYLKGEKGLTLKIDRKETKSIVDGEEVVNNIIVAVIEHCNYDTGEIKTITPDIYFNTFRYKLFCLMVSLSLALATRRKYNLNLPLVMDDLFYASDFISKHSFSKFIIKVINLFYKYSPDLPLQFILFTHDDMIFKSALDSLDNMNIDEIDSVGLCQENKRKLYEKTIIGRFFDPKDKDDIPEKFENGNYYWNLLYKLPKAILTE